MLTIRENRSFYSHYLRGRGLEFGALDSPNPLPEGSVALIADVMSTEALSRKYAGMPNVAPVDIVLGSPDLTDLEDASFDFVVANQVIEHLPNLLGAVETWGRKVRDFGYVVLGYPEPEVCADGRRRQTPLSHFISDYEKSTASVCEEHMLSYVWAWDSSQFPEPDRVEVCLRRLWAADAWDLDDEARDQLGVANLERMRILLEAPDTSETHHHALGMETLLQAFAWLAGHADGHRLVPVDLGLGKGLLNENILVLQRYPEAFVQSAEGRAVLDNHTRSLKTRLAAETWANRAVAEQAAYIQAQRSILDERYEMIQALQPDLTTASQSAPLLTPPTAASAPARPWWRLASEIRRWLG